ncbi:glycoside-pentoside-hexuronide (GPH):cation symporter [bacterium]|nr:glycoside-pentoside-hexuronide (GPH):cation symporter [bacterium]
MHLFFFYTESFGITAAAFSLMILVSRNLDAISDPLMGMIADRTETKWGKFRPYLLWLCVPLAILGMLMYTTPSFSGTGKIIWAWITFNLFMLAYTAINIPYTSILGVISSDSKERASVSSVKFSFSYTVALFVSAGMLPVVRLIGGDPKSQFGWQMMFVIVGGLAVGFFLISFSGTRERVRPPKTQAKFSEDLGDLLKNGPWLILLPLTFTFILFVATRLVVINHYFLYYVGDREVALPFFGTQAFTYDTLVSAFYFVGMASAIFGALFVGWFAQITGKKRAFAILMLIAVFSTASFYFLQPHQLGWIFFLQVLGSFTGGPLSALLWAMYSDTADYGEWKFGRRATGLVFSASTMSQKFGWAFGVAAAGWLLSRAGYVKDMVPTDEVRNVLVLFMSLIPAFVGLIPLGIMYFYPLDEERVSEIETELNQRKEANGSTD